MEDNFENVSLLYNIVQAKTDLAAFAAMGFTFNQLGVRNSIIHHGGPFVYFTDYERLNQVFRQHKSKKKQTSLVVPDEAKVVCKQPALQTTL